MEEKRLKGSKSSPEKVGKAKHYYEPECSEYVDVLDWQEDDEGHHFQVVVGKKNVQEEIERYKNATDIKVIVERMMNGDAATIRMLAAPGIYGDVNDYPEEVHPAGYAQGLKTLYDNQPDSVKEKFPTYELFAKFFTNLTEATIAGMYAPNEEVKENGEQ